VTRLPANIPGEPLPVRAFRFLGPLVLDVGIVIVSYAVALSLKFDGNVPAESWQQLAWAGPLIAFAYILAYQSFGVYRTAWQYGSVRDAFILALAVGVVTAAVLIVNLLLPKRPIPLTVNVISAAFIFVFHGTARMLPRLWSGASPMVNGYPNRPTERVLIVGAGDTGQLLAWELQHNRSQPYRAACFVDDEPSLKGKRIHGVPVAGNRYDIPEAIEKYRVSLVALALGPEVAPRLQEVLALIEPSGVPVRLVPTLSDVMEGRAARGEMREITMEDLLAREPVDVEEVACRQAIRGKVVMVTGAAGSIGSELTRKILEYGPAALHLLDTNETGLHQMRVEVMQKGPPTISVKPWLCSITDRQKVHDIFEAARPRVVFHLAAYKHVPMMEEHPDQAFETNVTGTLNIFEAAHAVGADQVVFLSSHTAVNPSSVYGASKRIGELLVSSMPEGRTKYCAIRLTNVIDAGGAVLSLFERQIRGGGPVSVTHPEVARYFLTVNEVAGLIIQAAALTRGGEVYLLDVGEEVRIGELAERLIRSRGMEPGKDIEIVYTGLRSGEKLRENLIGEHERLQTTSHPRVQVAVSSGSFSAAELRAGIEELEVDLRRRTGNIPAKLHSLARIDRGASAEPFLAEPEADSEVEAPPRPSDA
jgi:FlaA1/EpsC-like NDP-sugar epimerase